MAVKLSKRLRAIADAVPDAARVADVGTDHALLPIYLVEHERVPFAIATDVVPGPVRAAHDNVNRHHTAEHVSVRLGDGLQTVEPGEVDTIIIAGMGGGTAVQILQASPEVVMAAKRLIIQPMNASRQVRTYLQTSPFGLVDELLLEEDGRIYEVLVADIQADPVDAYRKYEGDVRQMWLAMEFGPILLRKGGPVLQHHLSQVLDAWKMTLRGLESGKSESAILRKSEVAKHVNWLQQWCEEELQ